MVDWTASKRGVASKSQEEIKKGSHATVGPARSGFDKHYNGRRRR